MQKDEQFKEIELFFRNLETNFQRHLELFKKKILQIFFEFHLFYENKVFTILAKIRKEITEIQKLLETDKKFFSNDRIKSFLEKQKEWEEIILPQLREEKERILKENKEKKVKINSNKFLSNFESLIKVILRPESLLKCGPLIFGREENNSPQKIKLLEESRNISLAANFDSDNRIIIDALPRIKQINDYKVLDYKSVNKKKI